MDAFQGWQLGAITGQTFYAQYSSLNATLVGPVGFAQVLTTGQGAANRMIAVNDGQNGAPRISSETRVVNGAIAPVILT